jgi:hypothetical protein
MSTKLLVSLLAAQVIAISLFFTDAFPPEVEPFLKLALAVTLTLAGAFFAAEMTGRAYDHYRR